MKRRRGSHCALKLHADKPLTELTRLDPMLKKPQIAKVMRIGIEAFSVGLHEHSPLLMDGFWPIWDID